MSKFVLRLPSFRSNIQIKACYLSVDVLSDKSSSFKQFHRSQFEHSLIYNIRVSQNNIAVAISNCKGEIRLARTYIIQDLKNAIKGTNIVALAAATSPIHELSKMDIKPSDNRFEIFLGVECHGRSANGKNGYCVNHGQHGSILAPTKTERKQKIVTQ